jgi:hypothetical protein
MGKTPASLNPNAGAARQKVSLLMCESRETMMVLSSRRVDQIVAALVQTKDPQAISLANRISSASRVQFALWWNDDEPPFRPDDAPKA